MTWLASLAAHERDGTPAVLVTVLDARGSAPREAGAKLVVTAAAQDGSIGGGALEHRCTEFSRALLAERAKTPVERAFPLGPELGQCCGGHVRVLFEPLFADAWPVALFGAGHVGQAVARLLADLPCRLRWIDSRADQFPALLPATVRATVSDAPEQEVARLAPGSAVLVMTHDHALDYRIVAACLARADLPWVGLIGSATKAARFRARLSREGLSPTGLECPVGVPGVGGKLPAEIAISIAARLLQRRAAAPAAPAQAAHPEPAHAEQACAGCEACVA